MPITSTDYVHSYLKHARHTGKIKRRIRKKRTPKNSRIPFLLFIIVRSMQQLLIDKVPRNIEKKEEKKNNKDCLTIRQDYSVCSLSSSIHFSGSQLRLTHNYLAKNNLLLFYFYFTFKFPSLFFNSLLTLIFMFLTLNKRLKIIVCIVEVEKATFSHGRYE